MKIASALIMSSALALITTAGVQAQGRHDERPHGTQKPAAKSEEQSSPGGMMGRHDERPHGPRKPAAKKPDAAPSDQTEKK